MENYTHYKALSDPTRRKIMELLQGSTLTAGEIATLCGKSQPNISHHLNVLKDSELVLHEKKGMHVHYSLKEKEIKKTPRNLGVSLNFKDKLLNEFRIIAGNKKCETVLGTESQDTGTLHILKGVKTLLTMDYSFLLSSFVLHFKIPANISSFTADYQDSDGIEQLLIRMNDLLTRIIKEEEAMEKELLTLKGFAFKEVFKQFPNRDLFMTKDEIKRNKVHSIVEQILKEKQMDTGKTQPILAELLDDVIGLGKLQPFMLDDTVTEIMVIGTEPVSIEQKGKLKSTSIQFESEDELRSFVDRICLHLGVTLNEYNPSITRRLPNGSQIQLVSSEISSKGISVTIQKNIESKRTLHDLLHVESLTHDMSTFLQRAIKSRANILIAGGTGAGKTTWLETLGNFSEEDTRIITIEDTREIDIKKPYVVNLVAKANNTAGIGHFPTMDCIRAAMHMRCDHLLVGELRDGGTNAFLQSIRSGQEGAVATINAYTVEGSLKRLEFLAQMTEGGDTKVEWGKKIAESIDLVVSVQRLKDGSKKITDIAEVIGYNISEQAYVLNPLFFWETESVEKLRCMGTHYYTGNSISYLLADKFNRYGFPTYIELEKEEDQDVEYIQKIEDQLPSACLQLAEGLRAGYSHHGVLKVVGEYGEKPLAEELLLCHDEMTLGKSTRTVLENLYARIPSQEIALLLQAVQIMDDTGESLEPILRQLASILASRKEIKQLIPVYKRKEEQASLLWQMGIFLDLLAMTKPSSRSLAGSIAFVSDRQETLISTTFKEYLTAVNQGRDHVAALKELADRIKLPEWKAFINQLIQCDIFGTSMDHTIISESEKLRSLIKMTYELKYKKRR